VQDCLRPLLWHGLLHALQLPALCWPRIAPRSTLSARHFAWIAPRVMLCAGSVARIAPWSFPLPLQPDVDCSMSDLCGSHRAEIAPWPTLAPDVLHRLLRAGFLRRVLKADHSVLNTCHTEPSVDCSLPGSLRSHRTRITSCSTLSGSHRTPIALCSTLGTYASLGLLLTPHFVSCVDRSMLDT